MKGRLLHNQLQEVDLLAAKALFEMHHDLLMIPDRDEWLTGVINILSGKCPIALPRFDEQTTYFYLLQLLEVMMYIERNKEEIEALPENHATTDAIAKIKEKIIALLSETVQSKKYPANNSEFLYDFILINYSQQSIKQEDIDIHLIKKYYDENNQTPVILKCGDKIFCYGITDEKIEKITELDAGKFTTIHFPQEINLPAFLSKESISDDIQEEIKIKKAHTIYNDYIYNETVLHYTRTLRRVTLSDNVSEMILLGFLRIIESLNQAEKNNRVVKHITQLIRNSRHIWLSTLDNSSALHLRKSLGGTEYESTNNEKTWMGLVKILNYVYFNKKRKNSKIGGLFTLFLQSLREENLFYLQEKENNKKNKDLKKGVIRNEDGLYPLEQFQYLPNKKTTPQAHATIMMQKLLKTIIDYSAQNHSKNSPHQPRVEYVMGANNKKECMITIPIEVEVADKNKNKKTKKEIIEKEFNVTAILKGQPLAHEINFSPEIRRLFLSAMMGCKLYICFSATKDEINEYAKKDKIEPNSCVIVCHKSKGLNQKNSIQLNEIYYVNFSKKLESLLDNEIAHSPGREENKNLINNKISRELENSLWFKNTLVTVISNEHLLVPIDIDADAETKKLFCAIDEVLSQNKILFLRQELLARGEIKPNMRQHELYSTLPFEDACAINLYTTDYYKMIQPFLRNFGIMPPDDLVYSPLSENPNTFSSHYEQKLGKGFGDNPYLLYKLIKDILIYSHFCSHGVSTIIKTNQKILLKSIKKEFDYTNCHFYIVSNKEDIEKCKSENKGQGIILYKPPKSDKIFLYHCVDNKLTKKFMDIDLEVSLNAQDFLSHFSKKINYYAKLTDLTCVARENYLIVPKTEGDKKLLNKFIHYAMWYCQLNIYDKKITRGNKEGNKFINLILPEVSKKIYTDGLFFSSANEFGSSSLAVCTSFLTLKGWRVLTIIHIPKSFIPLIMYLSHVGNELEALFSPNTRLVYYKVEKDASFRNITYHALMTDYDFNVNDPKWEKIINAQLKSELYTNIEFIKSDIKSNEKKIPQLFLELTNAGSNISSNELERVKPYFISKKYSPAIQLSAIEGSPIEIINDVNDYSISSLKQMVKNHELKNTYILLPIRNTILSTHSKGVAITGFKLYYVKNQESINEIIIHDVTTPQCIAIRNDLNNICGMLLQVKNKKLNAKEILMNDTMYQLDTLISAKNDSSLPVLVGVNDNFHREGKKIVRSKSNFTRKSLRMNNGNLSPRKPVIHNEKLNELHKLIIKNNQSHEELLQQERELNSIKAEEPSNNLRASGFVNGKLHDLKKENIVNETKQLIKIINKIKKQNNFNLLSTNYSVNLKLIKNLVKLLEQDKKPQLLDKIKKSLDSLSILSSLIHLNSKSELIDLLKDKVDVAVMLYLFTQLYDVYPQIKTMAWEVPHITWFKEGLTFDDVSLIIKNNTGLETKQQISKNNIKIDVLQLKNITNALQDYIKKYPKAHKDAVKILKKIMNELNSSLITEENLAGITKYYFELLDILSSYNHDKNKSILSEDESEIIRLLEHCKKLLDPIVPSNTKKLIDSDVQCSPKTDSSPSEKTVSSNSSNTELDSASSQGSLAVKIGLFSQQDSVFQENFSAAILLDNLMTAIKNKNLEAVNKILAEANQSGQIRNVLKSFDQEGETPLHVAILEFKDIEKTNFIEKQEGLILLALLSQHVNCGLEIKGTHHLDARGFSPAKLATDIIDKSEELAGFMFFEYGNLLKNKEKVIEKNILNTSVNL